MRYASIRELDISNGEGIGVALFVQGCHFHCYNCFNPGTWDFNGGKQWTNAVKNEFMNLIDRPHITRVSILGGEPLADENLLEVYQLIVDISKKFNGTKKIWLYTGYTWPFYPTDTERRKIFYGCDVVVDGKYIHQLANRQHKWAGSINQRVIDVRATIANDFEIMLLEGCEIVNREQRRKFIKRMSKKSGTLIDFLEAQSSKENEIFFKEGTKVRINPEKVSLGNPKRTRWIEENIETEFTIEYDTRWGTKPSIYCLKEDTSELKWYFAHFELLAI